MKIKACVCACVCFTNHKASGYYSYDSRFFSSDKGRLHSLYSNTLAHVSLELHTFLTPASLNA